MKENTLLKIALACSLAGLAVLYFASLGMELKDYSPSALGKSIGDDVILKGTVSKITDRGDVVFIEVTQQIPVNSVLFPSKDKTNLKSGDKIEIIGHVQEYDGKEEIIAQKIRVIETS